MLVHCHAGRSRSVAVVARYLIESQGMTQQAALVLIMQKREIYLSDGIEELLVGLLPAPSDLVTRLPNRMTISVRCHD